MTYNFSMNNNLVLICEMSLLLEPCMDDDDIFLTSKGKVYFLKSKSWFYDSHSILHTKFV